VPLAPSSYTADPLKLFGYLNGWEYTKFARRVIQIDHDIYDATFDTAVSRLWNSQNWLPTANALLRTDWSGIPGITNIDPVYSLTPNSPYELIQSWRNWVDTENPPLCSEPVPLCPDDCYVEEAYTSTGNAVDLAWAGAPRTDGFLPYFPASIITGCQTGRLSLARATQVLLEEVGIFQNVEEIARWINAKEHNIFKEEGDLDARQDMLAFIHFTYWREPPPGMERKVVFLSGWSVALFQIRAASMIAPTDS
jgi:hypothetical protein